MCMCVAAVGTKKKVNLQITFKNRSHSFLKLWGDEVFAFKAVLVEIFTVEVALNKG